MDEPRRSIGDQDRDRTQCGMTGRGGKVTKDDQSRDVAPVPAVLYNVEEAAQALRLSRWTLCELIRSGRLRTVKQGQRRLVPVAALHEYVALLESERAA